METRGSKGSKGKNETLGKKKGPEGNTCIAMTRKGSRDAMKRGQNTTRRRKQDGNEKRHEQEEAERRQEQ